MTREIKFRAWIVSSEVMIDWNRLCQREDAGFNLTESIDRKIMQFTGLKDKNGVEIYEGDIVQTICYALKGKKKIEEKHIAPIVWIEDRCCFDADLQYEPRDFTELIERSRIEVIGNIYQNPELLK